MYKAATSTTSRITEAEAAPKVMNKEGDTLASRTDFEGVCVLDTGSATSWWVGTSESLQTFRRLKFKTSGDFCLMASVIWKRMLFEVSQ